MSQCDNITISTFVIQYSKQSQRTMNNEQRTSNRPNQIVVEKQRKKDLEQCSKTRKHDERLALRTSFRGNFQDEMNQA